MNCYRVTASDDRMTVGGVTMGCFLSVLCLVAALCVPANADDCCVPPMRGNADGSPDDAVTLGDLTVFVDRLYIAPGPPDCWEEANVDGSLPEGPGSVTIGDITVLIDHLFISLRPLPLCPGVVPSGSVSAHSACKTTLARDTLPTDQDCLSWTYDGAGTLVIDHLNAGLNCCPVILADIGVTGSEILITQIDSLNMGGCDCNCLFDIQYTVTGIAPGDYRLRVVEPYRYQGDPPLDITINLIAEPTGTHCESRTRYPWDI